MKKIYTSITATLLLLSAAAQVPNSGFESWTNMGTYDDPTNWETSNGNSQANVHVTQVSNAHGGSSAMRMNTWTVQSFTFGAIAACPYNGGFFAVTGQPAQLTGWYIASFANGDKLNATVALQQNSTTIGGGSGFVTTNTSIYQQFSIPLSASGVPDSATIVFNQVTSSGAATGLDPATYVILDDIQLAVTPGFAEPATGNTIEKIYPNPGSGTSWVEYSLTGACDVTLGVYDVNGNLVQPLVGQEQQPGRFRVAVETSALAAGLYVVRLQTGGSYSSMKLSVVTPQ